MRSGPLKGCRSKKTNEIKVAVAGAANDELRTWFCVLPIAGSR